ncbi:MAG TPA: glycosyltransferase family 2 protein [Bacteroidales bacterium]|nr:glycosyltransferase family 2 protein [Bacteroidales bacterium]
MTTSAVNTLLPAIFVALPVMDEAENISVFISDFKQQNYKGRSFLFVCVNQPDHWWSDPAKVAVCNRNADTLRFLGELSLPGLEVIDCSSPGKGWHGKKHGVGIARRVVMDSVVNLAKGSDLIVCLDADTRFGSGYFTSLAATLGSNHDVIAISVPYYHNLTDDDIINRAILRYEIYMRHYAIQMLLCGTPFHFTALGSAMVTTAAAYKKIGGITPKLSGEDFYFLQKLTKAGKVITWNPEFVYPAARFSNRVYFGTGPAMIRGAAGDWSSYPVYDKQDFDLIRKTIATFPCLYDLDLPTPMDVFLKQCFGSQIWEPLRRNSTTREQFVKACHQKIDGLRLLQFLKWMHHTKNSSDEQRLSGFIESQYGKQTLIHLLGEHQNFSFINSPISLLNRVRNFLAKKEWELRQLTVNQNNISLT